MTWVLMVCIDDREGWCRDGELVVWRGEWWRSPEDVADRERSPILKLYRFEGVRMSPDPIMGDVQYYVRASDGAFAPFDLPG